MEKNIKGKTAFITGATAGIGYSIAKILANDIQHLIITGRREQRLQEIKEFLIQNYNVEVTTLCFDVRNFEAVQETFYSLRIKKIDILINNAGLALGFGPIQEGNLEHWESMIDTNIKGLLYVSKMVIPMLPKYGHIINIGSIAGKEVYSNGNVYCGTKHMVDALTKSFRMDLAEKGIKVSAIHPGAVDTEFSIVGFEGDKKKAEQVYLGFVNLLPEDIAEAVYWVLNQPRHVNINDMVIMPTAQPNASTILRNKGL